MTEQELIDTINALIDADLQAERTVLDPKDIARRAIDRCGDGLFTTEAVTDLARQILDVRCEPWKVLPGTRPRLRVWGEGVVRLVPKPGVIEILEAGREAGEQLAVTLARVRRAYPGIRARDVPQVIMAPPREHSRKPDEQYARIERLYGGPYVELFARLRRDGWDVWGDEAQPRARTPKLPRAAAIMQ